MKYKVKATGQIGTKVGSTADAVELLIDTPAHLPAQRQWFNNNEVESTTIGTKLQPAMPPPATPVPVKKAVAKPVVKKAAKKANKAQ